MIDAVAAGRLDGEIAAVGSDVRDAPALRRDAEARALEMMSLVGLDSALARRYPQGIRHGRRQWS